MFSARAFPGGRAVDAFSGRAGKGGIARTRRRGEGNPEVFRRFFHAEYWTSFALGRALLPTVVVAVLLTAGAVVLALSERRSTVATLPAKHVIEASSQAKRTRSYSPTAEQWAMLTVEPVADACIPHRALHRGQNLDQRRPVDAGVPALRRPRHQADRQARGQRTGRPAAVLHRSDRHGAGAERFPRRACADQQGARPRCADRDRRQAEPQAAREPRRARCATRRSRKPMSRRRAASCASPRPRSRRRATGCASSARPRRRSRSSRIRAASARRRRSMRRSAAPSCSARSGPASMSATPAPARSIRCS